MARRKPSIEKGRAPRVSWVSRIIQLVILLGVVGGAMIVLHVFEIVDLYEMIERLRILVAGLT